MHRYFRFGDLKELELVWEFTDEDQTAEIYNIIVDTFPKDIIDLYVIQSNFTIRKFSSHINGEELNFEENPVPYNMEHLIKKENKVNSGEKTAGAGSSKKTNLYEQFKGDIIIVNQMLYSQLGIIDLSAKAIENKFQVGFTLVDHPFKYIEQASKITYSANEGKLFIIN